MEFKQKLKQVGNYLLLTQIGEGNFGQVWKSVLKNQRGEYIAVRQLNRQSIGIENPIISMISHQNLVKFHDVFLTELMQEGTLQDYLKYRGKVSEQEAMHILQNLVDGLKVLRDNNIVQKNLKASNIFLCQQATQNIFKLGDFGIYKVEKAHEIIQDS